MKNIFCYSNLQEKEKINVFTTRPDTIFGASFLAVSVDHPICNKFLKDEKYNKFKKRIYQIYITDSRASRIFQPDTLTF